jgi:hypothetical protein
MAEDAFETWAKENVAPTTDSPKVKLKDAQPAQGYSLQEKIAIAMAQGNNGGSWNSSYMEQHREVWRKRAQAVIDLVDQQRAAEAAERATQAKGKKK